MEPNLRPCPPLEELSDLELCYIAACELGKYFLAKGYLESSSVPSASDKAMLALAAINELGISLAYEIDVFKASKTTGEGQISFVLAQTAEKAVLLLLARLASYTTLPKTL